MILENNYPYFSIFAVTGWGLGLITGIYGS
jgi:hypothetical protein